MALVMNLKGAIGNLAASQRSATPSADCLPWALPSQRLARIQKCIDAASEQEDFEEIAALSSKALEISPLNWRFHFLRAAASVQFPIPDVETARAGFTAARRLHPNLVSICLEEGRLWQAAGQPEESIVALREALRRTPRSTMPIEGVFASCLNAVGPRIDQRLRLRPLADSDRSLLMPYLHSASGSEWEKETRVLLEKDPDFESFSSTQRKMLFEWWCFHPNREQLFIHLQNRPRLHADGWRCLALHMAEKGSFKEACELALRHSNRPSLPDLPTSEPLPELERRFARQPADPIAGLTLLFAQKRAGLHRDALRTLGQLRTRPNPPPYLPFLQFQLHSALEEWEAAWRSWKG